MYTFEHLRIGDIVVEILSYLNKSVANKFVFYRYIAIILHKRWTILLSGIINIIY